MRSTLFRFKTVSLTILLLGVCSAAQAPDERNNEQRTARHLESVRTQPELVLAFLHDMPKGGDLHNHLDGAIYAEDLIDFAASDNLCVNRTSSQLLAPPCNTCEKYRDKPAIQCAYRDQVLYNQIIDAWSMRNWRGGDESAHDHFFAAFDKFGLASHGHAAEAIATVANRAALEHVPYIEFMHTADSGRAAKLAASVEWDDDFAKLREKFLAAGIKDVVAETTQATNSVLERSRKDMHCETAQPDPGCAVTVRLIYQVLRGLPHEIVFAQILLGFELASTDPHFVGLNLVMPEDWYVPIRDFHEHMAMVDYLHSVYPKVHIALHAGELAMGLVKPEDLTYHIRESVEKGHAERIGHGVSVMNEKDAIGLLKEMAQRNVLVEINLTSNDLILGISGDDHPLRTYMKYGVPVALATDDEGVSRADMTREYLRAVENQGLSYTDLKRMARESLEHSFLPGESLWAQTKPSFIAAKPCAVSSIDKPSAACEKVLSTSERAREQWKLEAAFHTFEDQYQSQSAITEKTSKQAASSRAKQ